MIQQIVNSSATAFEGPVVASFVTTVPNATCRRGKGSIIVAANDSAGGTDHGVRIFADPAEINDVASCWNQHAFHITNVSTGFGMIPQVEPPSWTAGPPARNTYRVQAWQ